MATKTSNNTSLFSSINPSKNQVITSKKKSKPSKKSVTTTMMSKKKPTVKEYVPCRILLGDCEEMDDQDNNKELQCSSTTPARNITKLSQLDEQRIILNNLCTSLNKSDGFEDDDYESIEVDEDSGHYKRALLGSFTIYKFKPKLSSQLKPLNDYLYDPPFRVKKKEMRKAGFWKDWKARLARNVDFTAEDIEEDLDSKIEAVIEYFENFDCSEYTNNEDCYSEAQHKTEFHAPYLPTHHELRVLHSLQIKVDSSGKKWKDIPTTYCSNLYDRKKQKYGLFSRRESDKLRQNWEDFKKEYRFYDLRALLGVRTFLLEGNAQRFTYTKVQYICIDQHFAFIKYLGRGLECRSIHQLYEHAANSLFNHVSSNSNTRKLSTTRELHLMDLFINKFGLNVQLMEFLLHSKTQKQFARMLYRYYRFRRCPFNSGPWSSAEVLRLMDSISHYSLQPAATQRTALPGTYKNAVNWTQVMERVQTRSPDECAYMFHNLLKQALKSRYYSNAKQDQVQWTAKHELLLIKELCQTTEDSLNRVDFYKLSTRPEFEPFCDDFLKRLAREVILSRVPVSKRRYFDDSLDYLNTEVIPVLSNKIEEHDEVFNTRYLSKAHDIMQVFPDYLNKHVIKMFSSLPLHESMDTAEALQGIGEAADEHADSVPCVASHTSPLNSDAEETRETIPQSSADTLPSQRNGAKLGPPAKRKRQRKHELSFNSSNKYKTKSRKKQRLTDDVVPLSPPRVPTSIPLDVITLD